MVHNWHEPCTLWSGPVCEMCLSLDQSSISRLLLRHFKQAAGETFLFSCENTVDASKVTNDRLINEIFLNIFSILIKLNSKV